MNASKKIMNQGKKEETISTSSAPKTNSKVKLGGASDGPGMKTYVLGGFCVALILILCIGVGIQQFKPSTVLKIDGEKITMDDMMYPIYERESKYLPSNEIYESYLGTSIWDTGYMGTDSTVDSNVTNAEGLKQEIINAETEYAVLYNEAVKAKYKLTKDEEKDETAVFPCGCGRVYDGGSHLAAAGNFGVFYRSRECLESYGVRT